MYNRNYLTNNEKYLLSIVVVMFVLAFVLMGCVGPTGDLGRQGTPGYTPVVAMLPASLSECLNGGVEVYVDNAETIICNGVNGNPGGVGPQGPSGDDGQDSNPVVIFKFCPNVVANYPSSFPEYGIRLNNNVYGVYSANGGFLTLLIPGSYTTTGIGANCNFTIHNDGSITY